MRAIEVPAKKEIRIVTPEVISRTTNIGIGYSKNIVAILTHPTWKHEQRLPVYMIFIYICIYFGSSFANLSQTSAGFGVAPTQAL